MKRMRSRTDSVNVALHARWEIVVDDFTDAFEVHPTSHHFRTNHDPAFTLTHPADGVFTLFSAHAGVQTVNVWYTVKHQLF